MCSVAVGCAFAALGALAHSRPLERLRYVVQPMSPFFAGPDGFQPPSQLQLESLNILDWCRPASVPGGCVLKGRMALSVTSA